MAGVGDAGLIAAQRRAMFEDSGQMGEDMPGMETKFVEWVKPRLSDGSYTGWLGEEDGRVVAGAGVWWMDFPPHWKDAGAVRAYLLNVYVAPAWRGRGLAEELLKLTLAEVARRGVKVYTLHASTDGAKAV